jgi:hypothetical protein
MIFATSLSPGYFNQTFIRTEEQIGSSLHRMDLITQHPSNDYSFLYFDVTIRSTVTLEDISSSPINPNDA